MGICSIAGARRVLRSSIWLYGVGERGNFDGKYLSLLWKKLPFLDVGFDLIEIEGEGAGRKNY